MLKDVPRDVPSNQEVDLYIRNLLGKEVPLVCTYEGTSLKDGVRLTMLTGECVNDTINQLLTPGWKDKNNNGNNNQSQIRQDFEKVTQCIYFSS